MDTRYRERVGMIPCKDWVLESAIMNTWGLKGGRALMAIAGGVWYRPEDGKRRCGEERLDCGRSCGHCDYWLMFYASCSCSCGAEV